MYGYKHINPFKNLSQTEQTELFKQFETSVDYQFLKDNFSMVSTPRMLKNGSIAFAVKIDVWYFKESGKNGDRILVAYANGYLRSTVINHISGKIGDHGNFSDSSVVKKFDAEYNLFETYCKMFARMREYVVKNKLV
jgi:hypothetical protein